MLDFSGKSVWVTGGSRGIGRATAVTLAGLGATVARERRLHVLLLPPLPPAVREAVGLATRLQEAHPLASGLQSAPTAIFQGSTILLASGDPQKDVLTAHPDSAVIAGFAWPEAQERLKGALLVGSHRKGRGAVILFSQEPAYRLFWRSTAPLFLNSVMYAPSLVERRQLSN